MVSFGGVASSLQSAKSLVGAKRDTAHDED